MNINYVLTVGTYSEGNLLVVYDMSRHVLPTAPSPTTTHLIVCMLEPYGNCKSHRRNILNHSLNSYINRVDWKLTGMWFPQTVGIYIQYIYQYNTNCGVSF